MTDRESLMRADAAVDGAEALVVTGDHRAALIAFEDGRKRYEDLHLPLEVAYCNHRMGAVLDDLGLHAEAECRIKLARATYEVHEEWAGVAYCDQSLGSAAFQQNCHDRARGYFEAALAILQRTRADPADIAACNGNLGVVLLGAGELDHARPLLEAALAGSREELRSRWELDLGNLEMATGDQEKARGYIERARAGFEARGQRLLVAYCEHNLANLEACLGDLKAAQARLIAVRRTYARASLPTKVAAAELSLGCLAMAAGDRPQAEDLLRAARRGFRGLDLESALCDHNMALLARQRGDGPSALRLALAALAVIDAHRYTLRGQSTRTAWSIRHAGVYKLCFELAGEADDASLVAELIESARMQCVPAVGSEEEEGRAALDIALAAAGRSLADPDAIDRTSGVEPLPDLVEAEAGGSSLAEANAALAAVGLLPLFPCPAVAVDGPSRLGALEVGVARPTEVNVSAVREMVAGKDAWWWGTWATGDHLWWALLPPEGPPAWGVIDLGANGTAGRALAQLRACLPDRLPGETADEAAERQRRGPLGSEGAPAAELALARSLGAELLPPPLAEALEERARRGEGPMPLLIAPAPVLGTVPFALLVVPCREPRRAPLRVLDVAVVRLAPSAALLDSMAGRDDPPSPRRRPLEVAVVDPLGDLHYARSAPPRARRILAGPGIINAQPRGISAAATRLALSEVLVEVGAGAPAVVVFEGHAVAGSPGAPSTAALLLSDGPVPATDLLGASSDGLLFPLPQRVLLATCSSSGAGEGGEWLGLAPAALFAGARTVIATSWSVPDDPAVQACDHALSRLLRGEDQVALAVRDFQRDCLRASKGSRVVPPVVWAAYVVVEAGRH